MWRKFREMEAVSLTIDGKPRQAVAVQAERRKGELSVWLVDSGGIPFFRVWERERLGLPGRDDFTWRQVSPNFAVSAEPIALSEWFAKRGAAAAAAPALSEFADVGDAPFYEGALDEAAFSEAA